MPRKKTIKITYPLYTLFSGKAYNFSTIKKGDLFLAYPNTFNDPFDGAILVDQMEFIKEYLRRRFGESFVSIGYKEVFEKNLPDIFALIDQYNYLAKRMAFALSSYSKECELFLNIDVIN